MYGGAIPPIPHMSSWHSAWLIRHRDNFIIIIIIIIVVTCISDLQMEFGLVNRFIGFSQVVTTIIYNTPKINVLVTRRNYK
jgi:hypothetical protein